ncbi:MAG: Uma2 family endonuclease [Gemmatimonadetes bacterium]|nr:Uma2 family endonuclease [Gemmatimonadota bacterium]
MLTVPSTLMRAEDLLRWREPGKTAELIRGVLVVREPSGGLHGSLASRLEYRLRNFVEQHGLGEVFAQDTGFKIARDPDTVRAPDVAFVGRERLAEIPEGYPELAPDLVVEILSPGDRPGEVLEKVGDWLNAGTRLVWVLDARRRQARVHRADGSVSIVEADGVLDGEDVVPGFSLRLNELFRP